MSIIKPEVPEAAKGFEHVGTGLNVYESPDPVVGRAKWLDSPNDVISFVESGEDISDVIVIARGGTTTFLAMALNAGVRGVITLQGAPESHLGILSREYGIPCIMSVAFEKGVRTSRGEIIPADGVRLRMDVSSRPRGTVSAEAGAPRSSWRRSSCCWRSSRERSRTAWPATRSWWRGRRRRCSTSMTTRYTAS